MTTGTKAIMAAAGGGAAGEVYTILTLSDTSGSDKYYLSTVDIGRIAWSKEVGYSLSGSNDHIIFFYVERDCLVV